MIVCSKVGRVKVIWTQSNNTSKRTQTETQPWYESKILWLYCVQEVSWETSLCHLVSSEVSVLISDFSYLAWLLAWVNTDNSPQHPHLPLRYKCVCVWAMKGCKDAVRQMFSELPGNPRSHKEGGSAVLFMTLYVTTRMSVWGQRMKEFIPTTSCSSASENITKKGSVLKNAE